MLGRATSAIRRTGSTAPVPVVPIVGQTRTGRRPAATSASIAAASASGEMPCPPGSASTTQSALAPSPATRTALASDECVSAET